MGGRRDAAYDRAVDEGRERYTHGHHESVLRAHRWRTVENSAAFVLGDLEPGQRVVDVGCGPGTITAGLARIVAPGATLGVDRDAGVVAEAASAHSERQNLRFAVGDAYALPVDDGAADVVLFHQVLQHLADPVAALAEAGRALRPGGLVAARDADYGAFLWAPGDGRLDAWRDLYRAVARANGAQADAGRHLATWVAEAGFVDPRVTASTWTFATPEERAWWGGLWAERVTRSDLAARAIELGLASEADLESMAAAFTEWSSLPVGLFVVVHVEVVARRWR